MSLRNKSSGFQGHIGKSFVEAVVVSGDRPNFCGHMMLRVDSCYMYMMVSEFDKYLKQNGKTELFRTKRLLKNKNTARDKLKRLLSEKWLWLIVPNNLRILLRKLSGLVKMISD